MLGSSIGHYRITGRLGGGGMGEVWRAHDTQLNRDVAVDPRSDLFALGVVLYEMLTGQRAFRKATGAETMSAILNEEPLAADQVCPNARDLGLTGMLPHSGMRVSPKGDKFIAADTNHVVMVCFLNGTPPRKVPGITSDDPMLGWCEDNEPIFVTRSSGRWPVCIDQVNTATGQRGAKPVLVLSRSDMAGLGANRWIHVTPDGKAYLFSALRLLSDLYAAGGLR